MTFYIGGTAVVDNSANTPWSRITGHPANTIVSVTINGTGTTYAYVNAVGTTGTLVITRT